MARPGEGRRRRRDEEQLLLLLLARRRLRLARAGGASKVWALAIVELVLCVAALVAAAVTAGTAVQAALNDRTLSGRSAKPLPITSRVYARNGYYLGAIPSPVHSEPVEYDAIPSPG